MATASASEVGDTDFDINESTSTLHLEVGATWDKVLAFWTSLLITVGVCLWYRHVSLMRMRGLHLPPGSIGWPLLGETVSFIWDGKKYFKERLSRHGPVFTTHLLGQPMVVVSGSQQVQSVLLSEGSMVTNATPTSAKLLMGQGALCNTQGAAHRLHHRAIVSFFNHKTLSHFTPCVQRAVRSFIQKWCRKDRIVAVDECKLMASFISSKLLLGLDVTTEENERVSKMLARIHDGFFSIPLDWPGFALRKAVKARRQLMEFIEQRGAPLSTSLRKYLQALGSSTKECTDDASGTTKASERTDSSSAVSDDKKQATKTQMIDDSVPLGSLLPGPKTAYRLVENSIDDAKDTDDVTKVFGGSSSNAVELLFGGHDTLSSVCCAILLRLHEHGQVMQNIRDELLENGITTCAVDELTDVNCITFQKLTSLFYVNDVMNEVLRLMPPIAGTFRKTLQPMQIMGYDIPEGWSILCGITSTHEYYSSFENASTFDPARWSKLRESGPDARLERFEFLPFGGGQRRCVGKEMAKLVLKIFIIELAVGANWDIPNGTPKIKSSPIPFPADGLPLKFHQMRPADHSCPE